MAIISDNASVTDSPNEEWRDIPGYEGIYQASTYGRIKALVSGKKRKAGDILGGFQTNGYHYVRLTKNKVRIAYSVHRIVLATFRPHPNSHELDVNHLDGDKSNNRPENLEWCTHQENIAHGRQVLKAWPERSKLMLNPKNFLHMVAEVQRLQRFVMKHHQVTPRQMCDYMGIDIETSIGRSRFSLLIKCATVQTRDGKLYSYTPTENDILFAETLLSN